MTALEIKNGERKGYEFRVIGDLEADLLELFGRLFERIRRSLSRRHIEMGKHGLQITNAGVVRGSIGRDDETGDKLPRFVIDGKSVSWEEFGRMLMSYVGCDFKMEIFDRSESR